MTEAIEARRRDPDRRERILEAAAGLVAERGYHEVGMTDIGAAAGITGSAIYRHFDGKSACWRPCSTGSSMTWRRARRR